MNRSLVISGRPHLLDESAPERVSDEAVRAYDVRGVYGPQITESGARSLGLAYAAEARERGLLRIGVCRDGRVSSPSLEAALIAGLVAGGMQVERVGRGPTPMLAFAVRTRGLDGGIMVTASHNPADENGFKIMMGADRVHGAALKALIGRPGAPTRGGSVHEHSIEDAYVDRLVQAGEGGRPLRVAWDSGNGATGRVVERLAARLPGRHVLLHTAVDGAFPNHHPDPAVAANLHDLQLAVTTQGCDLGLAFDGDGDRIGVVDGAGAMIWADQLLLFLARDLLIDHPGAAVVADVKSSGVLFEGIEAAGGRAVMAPSGYVLIREAMKREGALLAGELSGHIFYADRWDGTDDALYVAVRLLCALARSPQTLAEFRRALTPVVAIPELRIPCAEPRRSAVVTEVAARLRAAGQGVDLGLGLRVISSDGWWLLRASGTEPKLTVRCEARDIAGMARIKAALRAQLALSGVEAAL